MKKTVLGLCLAMVVSLCPPAFAEDDDQNDNKFYIGVEAGNSFVYNHSGGFNTAGVFHNTGNDRGDAVLVGIHAGREFGPLRADLGFTYRKHFDFTTNSFQPPTPTFFYESDVRAYTWMFNLYYDFMDIDKCRWTPYLGAGVGGSRVGITVNDTVVKGKEFDINFAWQAEAGIEYALTKCINLQLGYRYVDMGETTIPLRSIVGGMPSGNFKADLYSHEVVFGVSYRF